MFRLQGGMAFKNYPIIHRLLLLFSTLYSKVPANQRNLHGRMAKNEDYAVGSFFFLA